MGNTLKWLVYNLIILIHDNEDCAKIEETISSTLGVQISTVNAYREKSNVNNKPGKIVAELKSKKEKASIIDLAK